MQAPPATLSTTNTTVTLQQSNTASQQLPPDQQQLQQSQQSGTIQHNQQIPVTQSQTQGTQPQVTQTVTPAQTNATSSLVPPNLTINPNLYPPQQTLSNTNNKHDSLTQNTTQSVQQQQPSNTGSNVKTSISNNSSNSVMNNMSNNNNSNSSSASTVPLPNPSPSSLSSIKNEQGPVPLLSQHPQLLPITSSHNVGGMIPNMNSLMQSAASQLQQQLNAGQQLSNMLNVNAMKQSGVGGGNQSAVSELGMNPNFVDQIEMSLAQFENKNELMNNLSHSSLMHDISLLKQDQLSSLQAQQTIMNQMSHSQNLHMHLSNNGFGMEMAAAMNGLAPGMGNLQMHLNPMVANSQMPMFDPFNPLGKPPNYNNNPNNNSNNANNMHGGGGQQGKIKDEKYLGVRPLEDLMMNPNDKKMGNHGHDVNNKMGFGANNVKNANSWSSLASGSPQSTPKPKPPAMDTFQAFKKQAKEKEARQKLLEQQEIKRVQKEQEQKERQRQQEQIKAKQQQEQAEAQQAALNNGR